MPGCITEFWDLLVFNFWVVRSSEALFKWQHPCPLESPCCEHYRWSSFFIQFLLISVNPGFFWKLCQKLPYRDAFQRCLTIPSTCWLISLTHLISLCYHYLWLFYMHVIVLVLSHLSCIRLFATLGTVASQAPLSMGFSRQEYWSGLPCPPSGDLTDPGIEPAFLMGYCIGRRVLYH